MPRNRKQADPPKDSGRPSPGSNVEDEDAQWAINPLEEQLRLAALEAEMASKRAEEAEASRDAALRNVEGTRQQQRDPQQADQQRQYAVQSVIDQWPQRRSAFQQVGVPAADPAPVTRRTSTPVPGALTPRLLPPGVTARRFA